MPYLYHDIPPIEGYVREEYLRNMRDGHGNFHEAIIFGFDSIPGNVPLFHCLLPDGGIFSRLPISAFCWKECNPVSLHNLVLWDSFSYYPNVSIYDLFKAKRIKYVDREKTERWGKYLFTIDWAHENTQMIDTSFSEAAGQHKTGHVIQLDDGNYAIQPNNRVLIKEPSFCTSKNFKVKRLLHTHKWTVEDAEKWRLSDNDDYHYQIEEN